MGGGGGGLANAEVGSAALPSEVPASGIVRTQRSRRRFRRRYLVCIAYYRCRICSSAAPEAAVAMQFGEKCLVRVSDGVVSLFLVLVILWNLANIGWASYPQFFRPLQMATYTYQVRASSFSADSMLR